MLTRTNNFSSIGKIGVLIAGGIGDGLMFTPALRLLKKTYPHLLIDIICRKAGVKGVFEHNPFVNQVMSLDIPDVPLGKLLRRLPHLAQQIIAYRRNNYDAILVSFPAYRREYSFLAFLLGSHLRVGHRFSKGFFSQGHWLYHYREIFDESEHNVINNLNLLKVFGIDWRKIGKAETFRYDLTLSSEAQEGARQLLKLEPQKKWIGIHPGSTGSPIALMKRWPLERWCELAEELVKQGYAVWIFVGKEEANLAQTIQTQVKNSIYASPQLSFSESTALVEQMDLMITVDNGFGHVAAALNRPLISLWGPTNPTWCCPWNPGKVKVIRKARWEPWFRYECKIEPPKGVKSGMEDINVKAVLEACDAV